MKIKIFRAIGPLIAALALVGLLIFLPINVGMKYSKDQLVKFAQSPLNTPSFTGYSIKNKPIQTPSFYQFLDHQKWNMWILFTQVPISKNTILVLRHS